MTDFKLIDDLASKISDSIPPGLNQAREDIESNIQSILNKAFERMDLVTREQFEVQTAVLKRLRKKLDELEKKLDAIE